MDRSKWEDTLVHYGIKRRSGRYPWGSGEDPYQGDDPASKAKRKEAIKEFRKGVKEDKENAKMLGRNASIYNRALNIADKKLNRAQKKYDKDQTEKNEKKLEVAEKTQKDIQNMFNKYHTEMKQDYKRLIDKYGEEAITNIKYDRKGRVKEFTNTKQEYLAAIGAMALANGLMAVSSQPYAFLAFTPTAQRLGRQEYRKIYKHNK